MDIISSGTIITLKLCRIATLNITFRGASDSRFKGASDSRFKGASDSEFGVDSVSKPCTNQLALLDEIVLLSEHPDYQNYQNTLVIHDYTDQNAQPDPDQELYIFLNQDPSGDQFIELNESKISEEIPLQAVYVSADSKNLLSQDQTFHAEPNTSPVVGGKEEEKEICDASRKRK